MIFKWTDRVQESTYLLESNVWFFVPGKPVPAGSKRGFVNPKTGGVIITDQSGKPLKNWVNQLKDHALRASKPKMMMNGPLSVWVIFILARPKGHFKTKKGVVSEEIKESAPPFPITRPDTTKIWRAVEDAFTGILWLDDAQIVDQHISKRYGRPNGVLIELYHI